MKTMIKSRIGDMWLRQEDLAANIPGRPDSAAEIAVCIKYIRDTWARASNAVGIDEKARNAILHARVVGSFANPVLVQLREQLQQRDELLTQQDTTISRLLAFVPAKALAVSDERLQAIVAEVGEIAASVFKGHNIKWSLSDEDDPESLACHRFTVVVEMTDKDDLEELVVAEMKLREQLVSSMSDKELRALRILVEYETLARA